MSYTISVCIPTYNRPDLLEQAISSCLSQDRLPDEIVIGDDSKTDATQEFVESLRAKTAIPIRYQRNVPGLGQNLNISSTFQRATGTHIVLLHDDDMLTPNALKDLISCWDLHPDLAAAFGKQYSMSHEGEVNLKTSESLNEAYRRTAKQAGLQPRAWESGLSQQFPNDGYMVLAEAARDILWRPKSEVGDGGDFDFGLRFALRYPRIYFFNGYTSKYRQTRGQSVSSSLGDDSALHSYRIVRALDLPPEAAEYKHVRLLEFAPRAMIQAIRLGKKKEAWAIYTSSDHPWSKRFSLGGVRRLLQLLFSGGS